MLHPYQYNMHAFMGLTGTLTLHVNWSNVCCHPTFEQCPLGDARKKAAFSMWPYEIAAVWVVAGAITVI